MSRDDVCAVLGAAGPGASVVGTGLIALDIVIGQDPKTPPRFWAGGTCGNVLSVLGYLGWRAHPLGRLGTDSASTFVRADLARWGMKLEHAGLPPVARVPVIIQKIYKGKDGRREHRFSLTCPKCGCWFPAYKPVLNSAIEAARAELPPASVFFFDRVSRSSLTLAKIYAERGAIVYFEPTGIGEPKQFEEALQLAHVVKYSHQRIRELAFASKVRPSLEILTLGAAGLRFRTRSNPAWTEITAFSVNDVKDTAGCGDWCSAGVIHALGQNGLAGLASATQRDMRAAVQIGQALAAWNCSFEGARGGMYSVTKQAFYRQVEQILAGEAGLPDRTKEDDSTLINELLRSVCPQCVSGEPSKTAKRRRKHAT